MYMINSYLTDTFVIVKESTDKWGVKIETKGIIHKCKFFDEDKLITDIHGQEVMSHSLLICNVDEDIKYGDKIRVLTRMGRPFDMIDKKWMIHNICHEGGFNMQYHSIRM